ncbi:dihydrodipicolinate synthase/N-acetylneuraminate lyase [Haloferula helveola]|uniref:Dihydrodipicolinate synthase/N-acetylneuraminate lyase n=1 Tax=Haloferula helveola TaxID=490095 RepID=A0ABN6GXY7_9BACT|nr:dihydrodipicolinate synthase/N-acetylneuraminate lyase [Haloferula helveola]
MKFQLNGLVAATHTPFHPDGSLASEVVPVQAAHLAEQGIRSVFITGSTGEAHSLTRDERLAMFTAWAKAGPEHDIKVVAHVGSNCIEDAKAFAAAAADLGLDAISALAPSYYKPASIEDLVECCGAIASAAPSLPFYYYDIPVLTGVRFPMSDFLKSATGQIPNLVGIKFTNDDLDEFQVARSVGDFDLPWGIDEKLLDALQTGATGAVGSSYNFAAPLYRDLIDAYEAGDIDTARKLQQQAIDLIDTLAAIGYLGAAKAVMGWQGVPVGPARLPISNPTPAQLDALREKLHPPVLQS